MNFRHVSSFLATSFLGSKNLLDQRVLARDKGEFCYSLGFEG